MHTGFRGDGDDATLGKVQALWHKLRDGLCVPETAMKANHGRSRCGSAAGRVEDMGVQWTVLGFLVEIGIGITQHFAIAGFSDGR